MLGRYRQIFSAVIICGLVIALPHHAYAKKKKGKSPGVAVDESQFFDAEVSPGGKGSGKVKIQCMGNTPGQTKVTGKGMFFNSFPKLAKKASGKKRDKFKKLAKLGKDACKNPIFLSLDEYKGPFGFAEARMLYDRFAFSATPGEIDAAVAKGLKGTVNSLMTFVSEPGLDAVVKDLECDGRLPDDPNNETCDPNDPNDFSQTGVRKGQIYRMMNTQNRFFEKMFMFLHDERLSISTSKLGWCEQHSLFNYMSAVRNAARTGNYLQYMKDLQTSLFMRFVWLDGAYPGSNPNENWAREFWELGTVGPKDLKGLPVYSSLDIANSALAMSGWDVNYFENAFDHGYCDASFTPSQHAGGPKTIFAGTPYQAVVYDDDDVIEATFNHPRTAEHLAEDIWKEFVNPYATPAIIKEVAEEIRANGYNILPVIKKIMVSKALFDDKSRKSLIKQPIDLFLGFLRQTGFPEDVHGVDYYLSRLDQRPLRAPTVFGWDEVHLAGEGYVMEWRNVALDFVQWGDEDLIEKGYNLHAQFLSNPPATDQLIRRTADRFNVSLNDAQVASLVQYMNYNLEDCDWGHQSECAAGQSYQGLGQDYLDKDLFDPDAASDNWWKIRGVIGTLVMLPDYRMK